MSFVRWSAALALVVALGSCGRTNDQLNFQFTSESSIADFSTQQLPTPDEPSVVNSFSTDETTTEQIAAEFSRLIQLRLQCGRKPATCPVHQMTAPDSVYRRYLRALMKTRADAHLATRPGAGRFRFRIDNINLLSSFSAEVHTCIFDSLVVYDTGRSDQVGDDIVFDDDVISGHTAWLVIVHDDKWKWSEATATDTKYGEDICGFGS